MGAPSWALPTKVLPVILAASVSTVPSHLTFLQSIVIGIFQGISELFPISSLGHDVLIPKLFGWNDLLRSETASESFWLAFIVGLHVANALALLVFFWRDWVRIIAAFFRTLFKRRIETSTERLAWLIIVATIPVGIIGLLLEHAVRTLLAKPLSAAVFLMVNGLILLGAEMLRRRVLARAPAVAPGGADAPAGTAPAGGAGTRPAPTPASDRVDQSDPSSARLAALPWRDAVFIGFAQSLALIAGISRDGVCMVGGLLRGLDNEDAAKFAFLLSTPVILAAGALKIGDLTGPLGAGVRGQIVAGTVVTFVVSLLAIRFLVRFFRTRNLRPFGYYCLAFGAFMTVFTVAGA